MKAKKVKKVKEVKRERPVEANGELRHHQQIDIYRIRGNSMYPVLKDGDIGIVSKCSPKEAKIGDIVVFKSGENFVAHRLRRIHGKTPHSLFYAQGDKNRHKDPAFTSEDFVGKISSFRRARKIKSMKDRDVRYLTILALNFRLIMIPICNLILRLENYTISLFENLRSLWKNLIRVGISTEKQFYKNAVISVLQGILPFLLIICMKMLVDALSNPPGHSVSTWGNQTLLISFTAILFLFYALLNIIREYEMEKLSQSVTNKAYEQLHKKHSELDLSSYDDPTQQDKIHRAVQEAGFRPVKILGEVLTLIKTLTSVLAIFLIFGYIQWYLVLFLVFAFIPAVTVRLRFSGRHYHLKERQSPKEREMSYYNQILTGRPFAKDIRLFGFGSSFLGRFLAIKDSLNREKKDLERREFQQDLYAQLFAIILIFISLTFLVYLKTAGIISIGSVVLFFFVFQQGFSVFMELSRTLTDLLEDNLFLTDFISFLNHPVKARSVGFKMPPSPLKKGITVENVLFRYDTSKRDSLASVSLQIPAGKTVAFVGANGSGKTTMIKLLCGFYTPIEGTIRYDDTDLADLDKNALREQITSVFQDFAQYNVTAKENIGLGDVRKPLDMEKAKKAAEAAGMTKLIEHLPNGYDTLLGNLFKSGEELSLGQWQKVAIARAFYRDSPIIFMDEPSSALDIDSEKQMLESLRELGKDKTVVIVSHRLATVKWADIIYVFGRGEILESGSHQELMDRGGAYKELYLTANKETMTL